MKSSKPRAAALADHAYHAASVPLIFLMSLLVCSSAAAAAEEIPPEVEHAQGLTEKLRYAVDNHIAIPKWLFYTAGVVIVLSLLHYLLFVAPRAARAGNQGRQ